MQAEQESKLMCHVSAEACSDKIVPERLSDHISQYLVNYCTITHPLSAVGRHAAEPTNRRDFLPRVFRRVCCSKETDSDLVYFTNCSLNTSSGESKFDRDSPQMSNRPARHAGDSQRIYRTALLKSQA